MAYPDKKTPIVSKDLTVEEYIEILRRFPPKAGILFLVEGGCVVASPNKIYLNSNYCGGGEAFVISED